jgi:hypothetical protein
MRRTMDKIKRRKFRGNWILFIFLCLTLIGIPIAILYLIENTIEVEYEVDDAEEFLQHHYDKKVNRAFTIKR